MVAYYLLDLFSRDQPLSLGTTLVIAASTSTVYGRKQSIVGYVRHMTLVGYVRHMTLVGHVRHMTLVGHVRHVT